MSYKILLDGATLFSTDAAAVDPRFAVTVAALTEEEALSVTMDGPASATDVESALRTCWPALRWRCSVT